MARQSVTLTIEQDLRVLSEALPAGRVVDGVRIENPFA